MPKFDWSRFKNYGLWVSLLALIPMVLQSVGINIVAEQYSTVTNHILGILIALGILSNPTTANKWYLDDKVAEPEDPNK